MGQVLHSRFDTGCCSGNYAKMIASRLHNFIFIKTMKTAGTSIELALSPHCGPDDILSPISVAHDRERAAAGSFPRNFADPAMEQQYVEAIRQGKPRESKRLAAALEGVKPHARPKKIRKWVGEEFWKSAFKFTSERHPYEKALSLAHFTYRNEGDFSAHLNHIVFNDHRYVSFEWYLQGKDVIVDDFILYDTLQPDFDRITQRLGLPQIELPHARNTGQEKRPAQEVLSLNQMEFIREKCRPEFDLFGWPQYYSPEPDKVVLGL